MIASCLFCKRPSGQVQVGLRSRAGGCLGRSGGPRLRHFGGRLLRSSTSYQYASPSRLAYLAYLASSISISALVRSVGQITISISYWIMVTDQDDNRLQPEEVFERYDESDLKDLKEVEEVEEPRWV